MHTIKHLIKENSDEKSSEKTIDYENIKVMLDNIKDKLLGSAFEEAEKTCKELQSKMTEEA